MSKKYVRLHEVKPCECGDEGFATVFETVGNTSEAKSVCKACYMAEVIKAQNCYE